MDALLLAAAALTVVLVAAHSILGERFIIHRLMKRPQPELFGSDHFTKRTLRFAWHVLTILGLGLAAIMVWLAENPAPELAWILAATFVAMAVLTIIISRGQHLSWIVELAVAVLVLASV